MRKYKIKRAYRKNKPLINALISGTIYGLFCWSIDFSESIKEMFISLMFFFPGITFPLFTSYFKLKDKEFRIITHIILSILIYIASVYLYTGEGRIEYITVAAGAMGAFLYLFVTKLILYKEITFAHILIFTLISGASFLPYELLGRTSIYLGLAVLIWTTANGLLMNQVYKAQPSQK